MAFSLAHTITMDNTSDATQQQTCRDAIDYLFDTFLPARGWITTNDGTNRRRHQMPTLNALDGNNAEKFYGWSSYTSTTITQYEDSTYTTVPGDLGTDTTNNIFQTFWSSSWSWKDLNWKFWTSDEDSSLYLVTQGTFVHFWGFKPIVNIYNENATYATASNADTNRTHLFYPNYNTWYTSNQPSAIGGSSVEYNLALRCDETQYSEPDGLTFAKNPTWYYSSYPVATCPYNDIRRKIPPSSNRATSPQSSNSPMTDTLQKYFINGTDWWISWGGPTTSTPYLAFNFGTVEPDFT